MALYDFSVSNYILTINARVIEDFGSSETPVTFDPIDAKSQLRRGQGGNAVRLDRINPGITVNIFLNPGSPDSAFMRGLYDSYATVSVGAQQVGSTEAFLGTEGVIVNIGQVGRAGSTVTDDNYIIELNSWSIT